MLGGLDGWTGKWTTGGGRRRGFCGWRRGGGGAASRGLGEGGGLDRRRGKRANSRSVVGLEGQGAEELTWSSASSSSAKGSNAWERLLSFCARRGRARVSLCVRIQEGFLHFYHYKNDAYIFSTLVSRFFYFHHFCLCDTPCGLETLAPNQQG